MKRIKAFFYVIYKSLSTPSYYNEILDTNFSFSTKYFLSLSLLASLVIAITTTVKITPQLNKGFAELLGQVKELYPNDLVVTSKENVWSVNKPEPYIVPFPKMTQEENATIEETTSIEESQIPTNLIVLDHAGTVEDIEKHDTLILVNEKNLLIKDTSGLQTHPLENIPDGEYNKQKFDDLINKLQAIAPYIPFVVGVITLLFALFYFFVFRFSSLLIVGLVLWIANVTMKLGLTYKQAFRIAIHAMTLPLLIELVSVLANYQIPVPLWFLMVNIICGIVVLNNIEKTTSKQFE